MLLGAGPGPSLVPPGRRRLATFVVQCHVAFVVPAVAVVLAALVLCVRSGGGERWRPALLAGAAVVVVGWAPVVVEQVVADGGNLAALGSFFVTASVEPTAGPVQGAHPRHRDLGGPRGSAP
ncbi:MAG: hypothetical protein R2699_00165 [Acidimicrobiales bacterium]